MRDQDASRLPQGPHEREQDPAVSEEPAGRKDALEEDVLEDVAGGWSRQPRDE
jgi:hypothetical protein